MNIKKLMSATAFSFLMMSGLALTSRAALLGSFFVDPILGPGAHVYTYVNNQAAGGPAYNYNPAATGSNATTITLTNIPVYFAFYTGGLPTPLVHGIMNLTASPDLTASVPGYAFPLDLGNTIFRQNLVTSFTIKSDAVFDSLPIGSTILSMNSVRDTSFLFSSAGNLDIPMTFANGQVNFSHGGSTSQGAKIVFNSDFVPDVVGSSSNVYSFALTAASPIVVNAPPDTTSFGFDSFKGSLTGSFEYTVPEPGVLGMLLGAGVGGSMFCFKLRRRS